MEPKLLLNERRVLAEEAFVEMVVWSLPSPLSGSPHRFKYRLALVVKGNFVFRFANDAGSRDNTDIAPFDMSRYFLASA